MLLPALAEIPHPEITQSPMAATGTAGLADMVALFSTACSSLRPFRWLLDMKLYRMGDAKHSDIFYISQVTGRRGQSQFSRGMTQLSHRKAATLSQALGHAVWTGLSMLNSFCTVGVSSCL